MNALFFMSGVALYVVAAITLDTLTVQLGFVAGLLMAAGMTGWRK